MEKNIAITFDSNSKRIFSSILICIGLMSNHTLASPVHVESMNKRGQQEHGAGISVGKGSQCFVVVPAHVVRFSSRITITDQKGRSAEAKRFQAAEDFDAFLLKVDEPHSLDCPEDWESGAAGESLLDDVDFLIAKKVQKRGMAQKRFFPVGFSSTSISMEPLGKGKHAQLAEGDSGSSVYAKNKLVGMIVSVETDNGIATALKQSQIHSLFGSLVLEKSRKVALINPVYYRNRENRYATDAVKSFIGSQTSFDGVEIDPALAALNVKNARKGIAPQYPDNVDFVISNEIIESSSRRVTNPSYKSSTTKEKNFAKKLLVGLKNQNFRYYHVSNVNVEVEILMPLENQRIKQIERIEYKVPIKENTNERELATDAPVRATVDALENVMVRNGLSSVPKQDTEKDTGILGRFLKLPKGD